MTDVDIVNAALAQLGCNTITAIDDTTSEGRIAGKIYPVTRDALLALRQWTFARERLTLDQDVTTPPFGYAYRYIIPTRVLSVIRLFDGTAASLTNLFEFDDTGPGVIDDWTREGGYVLTNTASPVYAAVLVRATENAFHPIFIKALVAQLSADMAISLTENRAVADSWETKASARLIEAAVADGKQGISEVVTPTKMRGRRR